MAIALRISSKGQVTLKRETLAHLGLSPGQRVSVDLRPGGIVELRPAPTGRIEDAFDCLPPYEGPPVSIEDMSDAIARGWAGER